MELVDERIKALASEFRELYLKNPNKPINDLFMGFVTERLARLEVICEELLRREEDGNRNLSRRTSFTNSNWHST